VILVVLILAQDDEGHITKAAVKRLKKKRAKVGYHYSIFIPVSSDLSSIGYLILITKQ